MLNLKQIITGQIRSIDDNYIHTEEMDDITGIVSRCMYKKSDYRLAYNDNNISLFNKNTDADKLKKVKSV